MLAQRSYIDRLEEIQKSFPFLHASSVYFKQTDFLALDEKDLPFPNYDLIIDKGSFDAMLLNPDISKYTPLFVDQGETIDQIRTKRQEMIVTLYKTSLTKLLSKEGIFIITSCNWTKEELLNWFSGTWLLIINMIFVMMLAKRTSSY